MLFVTAAIRCHAGASVLDGYRGPLTGAAMNPARHLGTAMFEGLVGDAWMYWVGPVVGAALAALVYNQFIVHPRRR